MVVSLAKGVIRMARKGADAGGVSTPVVTLGCKASTGVGTALAEVRVYRWGEQQEGPCRVSVDWLAGTFVAGEQDPQRVIEECLGLGGYAGNLWEKQEGQTYYGWQEVWVGPVGVKLCRNYNRASMKPVGDHVVVPGQAGAAFGTVAVIELGRELDHATRVDVCLDDYGKRVRPAVILDRWERQDPGIVTRARTADYAGTADRGGCRRRIDGVPG